MKIVAYNESSILEAAKNVTPVIEMPGAMERLQANTIGDGLALTSDERLCAMMEAMKMGIGEIEEQTGWPVSWIFSVRMKPEYREMTRRCGRLVAEQTVSNADNVEDLFNSQIKPSARALIEVRDDPFAKGGDKIKAATEFLNRAKDAPKAQQIAVETKTVIALPVSELQNMQRALIEEGSKEDLEVYDLLKGRDFKVEGENGGGKESESDEIEEIGVIEVK